MCIIPLLMLRRFIKYKVDENDDSSEIEESEPATEQTSANTEEV